MWGLIKKDILVMRHQFHKRDILILAFLIMTSFLGLGNSGMFVVGALCLMVVSGYCNTIAIYDSRSRWEEYEGILPLTIKDKIISRYMVCTGMLVLMLVGLFIINLCLTVSSKNVHIYILLLEFFVAYMQMLIAIPLSLSKGGDKASYILFGVLGIIVMIYWAIKVIDFPIKKILSVFSEPVGLSILLVAITLIGTIVSYKYSLKNKSHMI